MTDWRTNIPPNGILCWVWDDDYDYKTVAIIKEYMPENIGWQYWDGESKWDNATPVTFEDVIPLLFVDPDIKSERSAWN